MDHFGRLLARSAIDSGATKRLLVHLLVESGLHEQDDANDIEEEAYASARKSLHRPLEDIEQILKANRES